MPSFSCCIRFPRRFVHGSAVLVLAASGLLALDRWLPPPLDRLHQIAVLALDGQDRILRGFTAAEGVWRLPVRPEDVDPLYLRMLLAYEDQRFAIHPGLDPLAIVRALGQWLSHGRVVSGASTLTMQAARLLEPHERDLSGKLGEMLRALQLERRYGKDEILSFYLTLAPFGGNLEGVRAASLAWFGKEPTRLTAAEAALLVVLPQSPSRLRPDRFPDRARAARDKVLARMGQLGVLTERQVEEARQEPLPVHCRPLPFLAPHLAGRCGPLGQTRCSTALSSTGACSRPWRRWPASSSPRWNPRAAWRSSSSPIATGGCWPTLAPAISTIRAAPGRWTWFGPSARRVRR